MSEIVCPMCHGRDGNIEITCTNCGGSGYDPNDDNPFAQCHTCYGEGTEEVDICPYCNGYGKIEDDENDDNDEYEEEDDED